MGQKDKISHFITDYYKKHNIFHSTYPNGDVKDKQSRYVGTY